MYNVIFDIIFYSESILILCNTYIILIECNKHLKKGCTT